MLDSNCYIYICMHGEPEDPGNIQQVAMSGLMFWISLKCCCMHTVFEELNGFLAKIVATYIVHLVVLVYRAVARLITLRALN